MSKLLLGVSVMTLSLVISFIQIILGMPYGKITATPFINLVAFLL